MQRTALDEQYHHCIVCLDRLSREVENTKQSLEISVLRDTLISIRNQRNDLAPVERRRLGLYNDDRLDYGVELPNKEIPWNLQTK